MAYNRTLVGPSPDQGFLVHAGVVVVVGIKETLLLPAGVVWPGTTALPGELMDWLCPAQTLLGGKDVVVPWVASPREIEFTTALVQVHWLRSRAPLVDRLDRLSALIDVSAHSQYALGTMLGVGQESMTHAMGIYRDRDGSNAAD